MLMIPAAVLAAAIVTLTRIGTRDVPLPEFPGWPARAAEHQIVVHAQYRLSYNETHEQPDWVMYQLKSVSLEDASFDRTDNFRPDPDVISYSATLEDYVRSGYDRGHLVPAADMAWSRDAMSETFYMSNMSPQDPRFNRGIWKTLETQVRDWAVKNGNLFVVTGPILEAGLGTIGSNRVSVPRRYYKIVLDYEEPEIKAIAFLMENKKLTGSLISYAVPVDSIESVTMIDFFPDLPDDLENRLESEVDTALWFNPR